MDVELLRTFLELHRGRHFGKAAAALNLTQAAVSQRLQTLEKSLGVRLFDRTTRQIRPTPAGTRLVRHAERQIAAWRMARQDVAATGSGQQLTIGGSLRLWNALLQPWLHTLRRRFPELAIIAESHTPELLTRGLIEGALDVAVMLEPAQLDGLQFEEVGALQLVLVSSARHLSVDRALGHGYVYVDWGLSHDLEHRRAFPDAPESMTRVSQAKIALEYLQDVGGSAYLPHNMVAAELANATLFRVGDAPVFSRMAYAVHPARSARLDFVATCIGLLRESGISAPRSSDGMPVETANRPHPG